LIYLAAIIFITTIGASLYALYENPRWIQEYSFHPVGVVKQKKYYTFITSGFLHADIPHLLFNMFTFYYFAFPLEKIIGSGHFFLLYFIALIVSDIPSYLQNRKNPYYFSLGASGALSAVIFSFIIFYPNSSLRIFLIPINIPAPIFAILYLTFTYYASKKADSHINHSAHLWGALFGFFYTIIFFPGRLSHFLSYFTTLF
jgi:membrane associated rhomboid family serine protease